MKKFLLGTPSYMTKDFDKELDKIKKYDSVSFVHNGNKLVFPIEEILNKYNKIPLFAPVTTATFAICYIIISRKYKGNDVVVEV